MDECSAIARAFDVSAGRGGNFLCRAVVVCGEFYIVAWFPRFHLFWYIYF